MSRFPRTALAALLVLALWAGCVSAALAEEGAPPAELSVQEIDTSAYPEVSLTVSMPGVKSGTAPDFTLAENGVTVDDYHAATAAESVPVRVVLVLDTSGSMAGKAWSDAQRAAAAFLTALGPDVPVSVISFNERAVERVAFTTDRTATVAELAKLKPAKETALYDAVVSAVRRLPAKGGERRLIVLLSDGGDTVSATSFNSAMSALKRSGVPLYAVALNTDEQNPQALKLLAARSGGRLVPAAKSEELAPLFTGIAEEIIGTYEVKYTSLRPRTKDVELDVNASTRASSAEAHVSYPNPMYLTAAAESDLKITSPAEDVARLIGAVSLIFLAVALLAFGVGRAIFRERSMLSHVRLYDQEERRGQWRGRGGRLGDVRRRAAEVVGPLIERLGIQRSLAPLFEAAGMPRPAAEYAVNYLVVALVALLGVQVLLGDILLTLIALVVLAVLPRPLLGMAIDRRRRTLEMQLPDTLAMLATSIRGGWPLERAIELAASEAPEPMNREFGRAVAWMGLGMPINDVLENMNRRIGSKDFEAVVSGVAVQREVGGNLAEVLDMVADTMREREALRRQVRTLTAEARFSAYILVALPFGVVLMMFITSRSYITELFTTPTGMAITAVASLMIAGGAWWIFRLAKVEV